MILKGLTGKKYNLEAKPFAQGGEGMVFNDVANPKIVCKIYKTGLNTSEKEKKLIFMVKKPPAKEVMDQISWPLDVLYDTNNRFVGFVMAKLNIADDLNIIYEFGESAKYKNIPWSNKIIIAQNLCAVLDAVHNAGHVIGDFNPKNISVNPKTGHIIFVDTDSYHIVEGTKTYRCNVGMSEYLPKEIQMKMTTSLESAHLPTFSFESDNFALAIHIFQLLMNGCHPFACRVIPGQVSITKPRRDENIVKGFCPFLQKSANFDIPSFAPEISILPSNIQTLFKRAFVDGTSNPSIRPSPEEWFQALRDLQINLKTCTRNPNHEYYSRLSQCPWCSSESNYNKTIINSASKMLSQQTISRPMSPSSGGSNNYTYSSSASFVQKQVNSGASFTGGAVAVKPIIPPKPHTYKKPISVLLFIMIILVAVLPFFLYLFKPYIVMGGIGIIVLITAILFNKKSRLSGFGNNYPVWCFLIPLIIVSAVFSIPFFNLEFVFPDLLVYKAMIASGSGESAKLNGAIIECYISYAFAYGGGMISMIVFACTGEKTSRSIYPIFGFAFGMCLYLFLMNTITINLNNLMTYKESVDFFTFLGSILMLIPVIGSEILMRLLGRTGEY